MRLLYKMYSLEELPGPAIELIFEYSTIDTCVILHEKYKFNKYMWRKKMSKPYGQTPEKLIFEDFNVKGDKIVNKILGCIYAGCDLNITTNKHIDYVQRAPEPLLNYLITYLIIGISKEIYQNYMKMLEYVIMNVKDINTKGSYGATALHFACSIKNIEVCKLLVMREDIDIDVRDDFGGTALETACASSNYKIIEFLIKNGANVEKDMDGYKSPLAYSIEWEDEELTKFLKEQISANK